MAILHFEGMYDLPSHDELREYAIILGYGDFSGKPLAWSESRTSRERSIKLHTADLDGVGWAFGALEILDDPKRALKLPTSVALLRQTVAKLGADHKTILKAGEVSFDALHNPQATWVDMLDCYKIVDEENVPAIITTSRESLQDARNAVEQKLRLIKQEAKKASGKGLDLPSDAAETLDQINAMLNFIEKKRKECCVAMLESLTDFWKPMKKGASEEKLQPELLQVGSTIGFGFVPQAILSGRRLTVSAINTYQFGEESLTSFILTQEKDPGVSMIVAESEGEQYLALSRRIPLADRIKLFNAPDFDTVINNADNAKLPCKDNLLDYKGWVVALYKREIHGMKGRIFKGDFRQAPLPAAKEAQEFEYTLLVSESNEQAIEIEKYADGRIEVYATVYRRMNDVGEITHPVGKEPTKEAVGRSDIKLASAPEKAPAAVATPVISQAPLPVTAKPEPLKLQELTPPVPLREEPKALPKNLPEPPAAKAATPATPEQKTPMTNTTVTTTPQTSTNGVKTMSTAMENNMKPKLYVQPTAPETYAKEIKTVTNGASNFESDAIECDLRVANKIIDEAIRNEMRLTDIVRRIIELPVANQESVQIPVTLTDEDYALLAIRYGISSSDRGAIKRRIIEDLNDFSGSAGAVKKAA